MNDTQKIIYSKFVIEFVTVAGEYCAFVEGVGKHDKATFLDLSQKILALLYLKASLLPVVAPENDDITEKFVTEDQWIAVKENIAQKLGDSEQFLEIIEPANASLGETVSVSLAECFADIYQDMKDFATLFSMGDETAMMSGLYDFRINFEQFWGPRAISALATIHNLKYNYTADEL